MNREIKFRGKNAYTGRWIFGFYFVFENRAKIYTAKPFKGEASFSESVDPKTVGQYTGGKANFNKGIYEGDIINIYDLENEKSIQAVVVFRFGCFSVCENGDPQNGTQTLLSLYCEDKTITVIGNIHDNPELLPNE